MNKIEERTAELIMEYNSLQNPEDVVAVLAGRVSRLETCLCESMLKDQELTIEVNNLRNYLEDAEQEIKSLHGEIRDAYSQGEQDGRASCEEPYY